MQRCFRGCYNLTVDLSRLEKLQWGWHPSDSRYVTVNVTNKYTVFQYRRGRKLRRAPSLSGQTTKHSVNKPLDYWSHPSKTSCSYLFHKEKILFRGVGWNEVRFGWIEKITPTNWHDLIPVTYCRGRMNWVRGYWVLLIALVSSLWYPLKWVISTLYGTVCAVRIPMRMISAFPGELSLNVQVSRCNTVKRLIVQCHWYTGSRYCSVARMPA